MQYAHEFAVHRPVAEVWQFVNDLPGLLKCIPGCTSADVNDDGSISAVLGDRVGPFRVEFHIRGVATVHSESYELSATADGKDIKLGSTMNLSLNMRLQSTGDNETQVSFESDVSILGKLATLGFAIMKDKASKTMKGFAENVRKRLEEGAA